MEMSAILSFPFTSAKDRKSSEYNFGCSSDIVGSDTAPRLWEFQNIQKITKYIENILIISNNIVGSGPDSEIAKLGQNRLQFQGFWKFDRNFDASWGLVIIQSLRIKWLSLRPIFG